MNDRTCLIGCVFYLLEKHFAKYFSKALTQFEEDVQRTSSPLLQRHTQCKKSDGGSASEEERVPKTAMRYCCSIYKRNDQRIRKRDFRLSVRRAEPRLKLN